MIFFLIAALVTASVSDIRFLKIPNWLTFSTIAVGIFYFGLVRGLEGLAFSIGGTLTGFALLIIPYFIGTTGAGDVKLMGAVGSFLGAHGIFVVFISSCILGGAYAFLLLASKGLLLSTFRRYGKILWCFIATQKLIYIPPPPKEKALKIRFALAITLGTGSYLVFGLLNIK
jgi:prepilin peptidase CpaA